MNIGFNPASLAISQTPQTKTSFSGYYGPYSTRQKVIDNAAIIQRKSIIDFTKMGKFLGVVNIDATNDIEHDIIKFDDPVNDLGSGYYLVWNGTGTVSGTGVSPHVDHMDYSRARVANKLERLTSDEISQITGQ